MTILKKPEGRGNGEKFDIPRAGRKGGFPPLKIEEEIL